MSILNYLGKKRKEPGIEPVPEVENVVKFKGKATSELVVKGKLVESPAPATVPALGHSSPTTISTSASTSKHS